MKGKMMLNIKPELWTRNGQTFVLLTLADFETVQEAVEDAGLLRILREAKKKDAGARRHTLDEVKAGLGMKPGRAKPSRKKNGAPSPARSIRSA